VNTILFSIVAPIYNEAFNIQEFYKRVRSVLDSIDESWEIIFVNDGSKDNSSELVYDLSQIDNRVILVDLARNFGHEIAVAAGLDYSRGAAVIVIDADLQDPPETIPDLISCWKNGHDVVYAVRTEREGETWFKKFTADLFYRIISTIGEIDIPKNSGNFRLLDRKVVEVICSMKEHHRFFRGMTSWVGFSQCAVPFKREARFAGKSKYPLKKMLGLAINAATSFSYFPLRISTYIGIVFAIISILCIPVIFILRLSNIQALTGQATTLVFLLFLSGIQLIALGISGEYLGRIYEEGKNRPLYIVCNQSKGSILHQKDSIE
jgi:polyisoprenyl-phosphate glycosyltransferase